MPDLVRAAALSNYAEVARSVGLDPRRMVAAVGLPHACLADPDAMIEGDAVRRLLEASADQAGVEDFGLRLAELRTFSNMGPVGLAMRDQPNVGKALEMLARHGRLHNESMSARVEETGDLAVMTVSIVTRRGAPARQVVELAMGVLVRSLRKLLGPGWRPLNTFFMHEAPRDPATHLRIFGPGLTFGQEFIGLVFARRDLQVRVAGADPVMARQVAVYLDEISDARPRSLRRKVAEMVTHLLPTGQCTIERLAQHMAVDRRTVHRRLAAEGATFSGIVQRTREDLARTYLADGRRSLSEIAPLLGFSSLSAFSRWRRTSQQEGESTTPKTPARPATPSPPSPPAAAGRSVRCSSGRRP